MQPIPPKHRKLIDADPYFKKCCVCGKVGVQIHHVFNYSGRQIIEMWNYMPVCKECHDECTPHNNKYKENTRYYVEWVCMIRAGNIIGYPKFNWLQLKSWLDNKFLGQYAH